MLENIKLGILGGGQLGSMLIRHAIDFGLKVSVMDKNHDAPCARYTPSFYCADPMHYQAVIEFGRNLDVLTIEKEAVNTEALRELQAMGVKVYPTPGTIDIIQDKYVQKQFLAAHGIPVAAGIAIAGREELEQYTEKLPGCLKKRRNGYDGYGVMMLKGTADIGKAFDEPSLLEEVVDIKQELSVIVARNEHGDIKTYDPVVMVFDEERFILDYQLSAAELQLDHAEEARQIAEKIAEALELTGILAVEMFITKDGRLLVNELAPRPHNSGHHTIEATVTSQYEQHLRAILGLPLGDTRVRSSSLMVNILEKAAEKRVNSGELSKRLLGMDGVHLHWYGKKENRQGRKIGHITITCGNMEQAMQKAETIRQILNQ